MILVKLGYNKENDLLMRVISENRTVMICNYNFKYEMLVIIKADESFCLEHSESILKLFFDDHFFEDRVKIKARKYRGLVKKFIKDAKHKTRDTAVDDHHKSQCDTDQGSQVLESV